MSDHTSIRNAADIANLIPSLLGFEPADSLVIMGLGGGPTARVDIANDTVAEAVAAMLPAVPHWGKGVIVAVYGDILTYRKAAATIHAALPVKVLASVRIEGGLVFDGSLTTGVEYDGKVEGSLAAVKVADSREALVTEAETVTDAETAVEMAIASYEAGNGARAWTFTDRARDLGSNSEALDGLEYALRNAIRPVTW